MVFGTTRNTSGDFSKSLVRSFRRKPSSYDWFGARSGAPRVVHVHTFLHKIHRSYISGVLLLLKLKIMLKYVFQSHCSMHSLSIEIRLTLFIRNSVNVGFPQIIDSSVTPTTIGFTTNNDMCSFVNNFLVVKYLTVIYC